MFDHEDKYLLFIFEQAFMTILYFLLLVCFSFINGNCSFDLPEEKKISVKQGAAIVQGLHDSGLIDGNGERGVLTTLNTLSHPFQLDPPTRTSSSAGRTLDDNGDHHNQPPIVATAPGEATLSNKQFYQIIDRHVFKKPNPAPFSRRSSDVSGVRPPSSHEEREDEEIESDHSQASRSTATR